MKYIFLNLKRFDIPPEAGGVNSLAPPSEWGARIAGAIGEGLGRRAEPTADAEFAAFFPEAHILGAVASVPVPSPESCRLEIGCQGVHHADTAKGGNFGAFTSLLTANAARALGCSWTMIGHSEERRYKTELMALAGAAPEGIFRAVHELLNRQVRCALQAGLKVLYCIGETAEEVPDRIGVLGRQLREGLASLDPAGIVLAYEPIWAIGPGKTPPPAEQIAAIAADIKKILPCPLVYGGGLKKENAASIGAIRELDGGLVALTRFTGQIGFYPEEYLEIVDAYLAGVVK